MLEQILQLLAPVLAAVMGGYAVHAGLLPWLSAAPTPPGKPDPLPLTGHPFLDRLISGEKQVVEAAARAAAEAYWSRIVPAPVPVEPEKKA